MPSRTLTEESRLLNRELSWIEFNARVLDLVADETVPLLERVKFCSIFSNNLDEFFQVRVAGLMGQAEAGFAVRSADGLSPADALEAIKKRVSELTGRQAKLWKRELRPALAAEGIEVVTVEECTSKELQRLEARFTRDIYPVLTPLAVGPGQPFPYISGLSNSLGVLAVDPESQEERFARVKVPEGLDRFVDAGGRLVPLESVISHFLPSLFPGMEIEERALFRVTRDADFELSDDADDLLEAVEHELRQRRFGDVVRVEVSASASAGMLQRLRVGLDVGEDQIYEIEGLLDLADLMQLTRLDRPDLKDEPWVPITQPRLARVPEPARMFDEIKRADVLVHQPYESFRTSFEAFAAAAAADRDVIAMKTAVYRTSDDSTLVSALVDCAEQGKQAVCLVELKARFDERRNIEWSRELDAGLLQLARPFDVAPLVEARLQLDEADRLFALLGAVDEGRKQGAVVGSAIHRSLHRDHVGVRCGGRGEGLETRPERLVWLVHEHVGTSDLVEDARGLQHACEARRCDRDPRLVLQVGPVETRQLHEVGEVEQALDLVDLVLLDVEALAQALQHPGRGRGGDLDPDDVAEAPLSQLELDCLEEVVGVVGELEVGVPRDAEQRPLGDLHPREERRQEMEITDSSGTRRPPASTKRSRPSGTFTRANRSSWLSGSTARTPSELERPEMYGNGWPGPTASGVSTG